MVGERISGHSADICNNLSVSEVYDVSCVYEPGAYCLANPLVGRSLTIFELFWGQIFLLDEHLGEDFFFDHIESNDQLGVPLFVGFSVVCKEINFFLGADPIPKEHERALTVKPIHEVVRKIQKFGCFLIEKQQPYFARFEVVG